MTKAASAHLVLAVCERSLLKSATLVPEAMHMSGQGHAGDDADQLHRRPVADVAVPHRELFGLRLILIRYEEIIAEYGEI